MVLAGTQNDPTLQGPIHLLHHHVCSARNEHSVNAGPHIVAKNIETAADEKPAAGEARREAAVGRVHARIRTTILSESNSGSVRTCPRTTGNPYTRSNHRGADPSSTTSAIASSSSCCSRSGAWSGSDSGSHSQAVVSPPPQPLASSLLATNPSGEKFPLRLAMLLSTSFLASSTRFSTEGFVPAPRQHERQQIAHALELPVCHQLGTKCKAQSTNLWHWTQTLPTLPGGHQARRPCQLRADRCCHHRRLSCQTIRRKVHRYSPPAPRP